MFIGNFQERPCYISFHAPNQSVCITGISGSGKTVRMERIELEEAKKGGTVLVIDTNQTHAREQVFPDIREEYESYANRIDALEDGLNVPFLTPLTNAKGGVEPFFHLLNRVVGALTAGQNMGAQQMGVLRSAIVEAVQNRTRFRTDAEAIAFCLLKAEDDRANAVYQRLWTVLNCGVLRPSRRNIELGKINIVDFSALDDLSKCMLMEIILTSIWNSAVFAGANSEIGWLLALDEFQNLSWKQDAVVRNILREGRKFGVGLLMATQTVGVFPKDVQMLLNQASTNLIFRPALGEIDRIAKTIDPFKPERWRSELSDLKIGECIALGDFRVRDHEIAHPIKLR